jgi:glycosidase
MDSSLRDIVIYHVFLDRFAVHSSNIAIDEDTPQFCGGSIRGVIEKLDYIRDLGAKALYLTPFNKCSAYHGYHITDFLEVDERFGTLSDLNELITLCHSFGMLFIMDFVPNHVSSKHPFFLDAENNPESKYRNWFYFTNWPKQKVCFLGLEMLSFNSYLFIRF